MQGFRPPHPLRPRPSRLIRGLSAQAAIGLAALVALGTPNTGCAPVEIAHRLDSIEEQCATAARQAEANHQLLELIRDEQTAQAKRVERPAERRKPRAEDTSRKQVAIAGSAAKGAKAPKVVIIEWSDFECPFCSRVVPTMDRILERWPDDVRLVFRHNPLPFHKRARGAAIAAEAAGKQGKFWPMHDLLFENNRALDPKDIESYARKIGLKIKRFRKDLKDPAIAALVDRDIADAQKHGARGTPTFFINGRSLVGARPFDAFAQRVEEEIKRADALLKAGVPRAKLYEQLSKD